MYKWNNKTFLTEGKFCCVFDVSVLIVCFNSCFCSSENSSSKSEILCESESEMSRSSSEMNHNTALLTFYRFYTTTTTQRIIIIRRTLSLFLGVGLWIS